MTIPSLPRIALTIGDPAGIGPETIVGAWSDPIVHACCRPVVVGHAELLRRAVRLRGIAAEVREIAAIDQADPTPGLIPCLTVCANDVLNIPHGRIDARGGEAAYRALLAAAHLRLPARSTA